MNRIAIAIVGSLWASGAFAQVTGPASQNGYPVASQPFAVSATSATASAAVTITKPVAYQNTYITSVTYTVTAGTVTAATSGSISNTVAYVIQSPPGTFTTFGGSYPLATTATGVAGAMNFAPALPGNGSTMVVTTPTFTGATAVTVTATGYFY